MKIKHITAMGMFICAATLLNGSSKLDYTRAEAATPRIIVEEGKFDKCITPDYVYTTTKVNIRKYADINSEIILTVEKNTELRRVGINVVDGWDLVSISGTNYSIRNKYITTIKPKEMTKTLAEQVADSAAAATDLKYLSAIIYAEAGNQCQTGQEAVGIIVMNRKESDLFENTIYDVITEPYQFAPVSNGSFAEALLLYENNQLPQETIDAAEYALCGHKTVNYNNTSINLSDFLYFSRRVDNARVVIQDHMFR